VATRPPRRGAGTSVTDLLPQPNRRRSA
jgi:hypothetical protein